MTLFDGKTNDQKVCDLYEIDQDILEELSESNEYWKKCLKFYNEVKDKLYNELTPKQIDWLDRIQDQYINQWERLC